MTKAVVAGLQYDTGTAILVAQMGCATESVSDFHHWAAALYRTKRGRYFLDGEGGPKSVFAESRDNND
ncbi:hypothetical protein [uncultured Jannaschia sp.]|uniref:hypothetical protein n=1 Tax=uncultured Jannaschia sp. TaxID=293347 RepID=UPI00262E3328|nr:hypothetical protein [uncultured Jannaschia sp.]